jgi:hypothetical protein
MEIDLSPETAERIRESIERISNAAQQFIDDYQRQETEFQQRLMEQS